VTRIVTAVGFYLSRVTGTKCRSQDGRNSRAALASIITPPTATRRRNGPTSEISIPRRSETPWQLPSKRGLLLDHPPAMPAFALARSVNSKTPTAMCARSPSSKSPSYGEAFARPGAPLGQRRFRAPWIRTETKSSSGSRRVRTPNNATASECAPWSKASGRIAARRARLPSPRGRNVDLPKSVQPSPTSTWECWRVARGNWARRLRFENRRAIACSIRLAPPFRQSPDARNCCSFASSATLLHHDSHESVTGPAHRKRLGRRIVACKR